MQSHFRPTGFHIRQDTSIPVKLPVFLLDCADAEANCDKRSLNLNNGIDKLDIGEVVLGDELYAPV